MGEDPILEEHSFIEPKGMIGGKRIESNSDGKLRKTIFVVACDACGYYPLNEFLMCKSCRGKLCDDCFTKLDGRPYCRSCLMELLPITSSAYKILSCVESEVSSVYEIADMTRIPKDEIRNSLAHMAAIKLLKTKGILAFTERKVTAEGLRALAAYSKFYEKDDDVKELKQSLEEAANGD
jgi:hypothetical protein